MAGLYLIISNPLKAAEWPCANLSHRRSTNKAKSQFIRMAEIGDMPAIIRDETGGIIIVSFNWVRSFLTLDSFHMQDQIKGLHSTWC